MNEQDGKKKMKCGNCESKIDYGRDLIVLEKGVHGPRGVVPLGEVMIFCSDRCVAEYFGEEPAVKRPRFPPRIP